MFKCWSSSKEKSRWEIWDIEKTDNDNDHIYTSNDPLDCGADEAHTTNGEFRKRDAVVVVETNNKFLLNLFLFYRFHLMAFLFLQ